MADPGLVQRLLEPIRVGPYRLANRIVMSAMTRNRSPREVPTPLNALYYAQRAGAGLIVTESTAVSREGLGWPGTPGIYTDEQVAGWRRVTDAVHARGGRIFLQLMHCGRNSHPSTRPGGMLPIGPSAVQPHGTIRALHGRVPAVVPREIPSAEIPRLVDDFRQAALRAQDAGFDGVEVHGANGYLIDQFLRDSANLRSDAYGGSPQRRCQLLFDIAQAVCGVWGAQRVGARLSPVSPTNYLLGDSDPDALMKAAMTGLDQLGLAYVVMVEGSSNASPPTHVLDYADYRRLYRGVYIANNGYTQARGEASLRAGLADMIAFGRLYIANPDLDRRFALRVALNALNQDTIYGPGAEGYTDYPALEEPRAGR